MVKQGRRQAELYAIFVFGYSNDIPLWIWLIVVYFVLIFSSGAADEPPPTATALNFAFCIHGRFVPGRRIPWRDSKTTTSKRQYDFGALTLLLYFPIIPSFHRFILPLIHYCILPYSMGSLTCRSTDQSCPSIRRLIDPPIQSVHDPAIWSILSIQHKFIDHNIIDIDNS